MAGFVSRSYEGEADLQVMTDLLLAARPAERIADYPSILDLQELFSRSGTHANMRLWEDDDGRLVGFAIVDLRQSSLHFEVVPQANGSNIATLIIAWGMERVQDAGRQPGESVELRTSCRGCYTERLALLERHGFVREEQCTLHMVRPLDEAIPTPQVPTGFAIRQVAGEHEAEALVALHRAAFGTENMTVEDRLSWMRVPEYDPELDLVAVAPDGTLAAYAFCSLSQEENAISGRRDGYTDPLATHPAFQRRGLARALLLTGFGLLKQRGVETARLSTGSWNTAMQETARSVGFRVDSTTAFFAKRDP